MEISYKKKNGFIYFSAETKEDISREQAECYQDEYGTKVKDNGFYAFMKRKLLDKQLIETTWCCRDNEHKLENVPVISSL